MNKPPSDRSIRGALTVLKKAGLYNISERSVQMEIGSIVTILSIPIKFVTPKKSTKKRMPKQKIVKLESDQKCEYDSFRDQFIKR